MARRPLLTRDDADRIAIAALGFLAEDAEQLDRFLALTGIEPASLRSAAREPNFLLGVIDHVASDDRLLQAFARANDLAPESVAEARDLLAQAPPSVD